AATTPTRSRSACGASGAPDPRPRLPGPPAGEHGAAAAADRAALGAVQLEGERADDEHARAVGHEVGAGRGVHAPLIGGARRAVRSFFDPESPRKPGSVLFSVRAHLRGRAE